MANIVYNWTRSWLPFGTTYQPDYLGFPSYGHYSFDTSKLTSDAVTLEEVKEVQCVVLLGEPGSGKSTEVRRIQHVDSFCFTYELNKRSSEHELFQGITSHPSFKEWQTSEKYLYLYLDGLDEALLNVKTIRNAIIDWLQIQKTSLNVGNDHPRKLFIRVTCRSAVWIDKTTNQLRDIFGPEQVRVFELAPLTQAEVRLAAKEHGVDEEDFIEKIASRDLVSFTSEPVSLKFLIQSFQSGRLHDDRFDKVSMFLEGAIHLATEVNEMHRANLIHTAEERVRIASRLATYLIFCNKSSIWQDESKLGSIWSDLLVDQVVRDNFKIDGEQFTLQLRGIKETLNTALFTLMSEEMRLAFKHRTYSEFLAAYHLNSQNATEEIVEQLLASPFDKLRSIPQIEEVLIWLATINERVFNKFRNSEPFLMLKVHRLFSTEERMNLVAAILKQATKYEITDNYDIRKFYNKLSHIGLADQLRTSLRLTKNTIVARAAIDIAGACRVIELVPRLLEIARDRKVEYHIRKEAINSVSEIGLPNSLDSFKEYVVKSNEEDLDDELKGIALKCLYPQSIGITEVINSLTPLKNKNFYGAYRGFLDSFAEALPEAELPMALNLLLRNNHVFKKSSSNYFENLLGKILSRSWPLVDGTIPASLMASFIRNFYENHISFEVYDDENKRRSVAREIFRSQSNREAIKPYELVGRIMHKGGALLNSSDWTWLITFLGDESNDAVIEYVAKLTKYLFNHTEARVVIDFFEIAFRKPKILEVYDGWLKPIELDSELAEELRQEFQNSRKPLTDRTEEDQLDPAVEVNLREIILEHLRKFEEGDLDHWWRIILALGADESNRIYSHSDFEFDVTKLSGWNLVDEEISERFRDGCKAYLHQYTKPVTDWVFSNEYNRRELAGYKALFFLASRQDPFLSTLTLDFWQRWHTIIFYCVMNHFGQEHETHKLLLQEVYEKSKDSILKLINVYFTVKLDQKKEVFELYKLKPVMDNGIAEVLTKLVSMPHGKNNEIVLEVMFSKNNSIARQFVWSHFDQLYSGRSKDPLFSIEASAYLIRHPLRQEWSLFWKKLTRNNEFAKKIVLRGSNVYGFGEDGNLSMLEPLQLAEMAKWLFKNFPPTKDPVHNSAYSPRSRDNVADLRKNIVKWLIELGTVESVLALKSLANTFENDENFKWWLISAREFLRKNTWVPMVPSHLREILHKFSQRVVRSENDLLFVVEESLIRLKKKLQGDNPVAFFLWNQEKNGVLKPKDENTLTDLIKMHLDYELKERKIIVNREVEIKRSTGRKDGQRTDLFIQAIGKNQDRPLSIVIEVKGCWHKEVTTAMATQLRDRYMAKHKSTHGLYVVGWFFCTHYRPRTRTTKGQIERRLTTQANHLTDAQVVLRSLVLDCTI
jgi:hypothetical protein